MDACAAEARALLAKLATLAADAQLRALLLRCKCAELERALQFVHKQRERREEANAETQQLSASLEDAIRRARQVRASLATEAADEEDAAADDEDTVADDDELQTILAMAKDIRALDVNTPPLRSTGKTSEKTPEPPRETRLEYPRRMKALLAQLREADERERHESFRFAFCRRMSERLGRVRAERDDDDNTDCAPLCRVHVGYKKQAARLQHAHRLLKDFVTERVGVGSESFERALESPTLGAVFPIYARAKQGKRMLELLSRETRAFSERAPPPPRLSREAAAHRDAMLSRIAVKKQQQQQQQPKEERIRNAALVASPLFVAHKPTLERLQRAWEASDGVGDCPPDNSPFDTTLREVVLMDASNIVLAFFKALFCDHPDDPDPSHVKNMLLLLRLVDSVAFRNGRRLRSVVALDQADS